MVFKPTTFGKYVLLKRIAIGGMAEVFRAKVFGAEGFEKLVALKRMLPHLSSDAQFVEMFINEAKLAALLNHANIVQIYDFGCIDKLYFISMEYVFGKDIADIIRQLRERNLTCPMEMACFLMIEVLNGLDYAHRFRDPFGNPLGLIHRDVSPHNILVSYEGEVKLVDFGIAKATSSTVHTTGGVLKGKYSYMSPEQAHGLALDHRSDIFSAAICFYELLTLTKMFQADSDLGVLEKVRETNFIPPRQINPLIPQELEDIILRALEKNPDDRYESAAQFRDALEQFLFQRHLHYSTSWLAGFMREIFREEIEKESVDFAQEAQSATKLRSEAHRLARLSEVEAGPDTVVLHRSRTQSEQQDDEPEDTIMETRQISPAGESSSNRAVSSKKPPSSPIVEIVEDSQIVPLEHSAASQEYQEEFMPTEKLERPNPQLFQKVVGKIDARNKQVQEPAIKEVFEDDEFDESITTTERQPPPASHPIDIPIQEPSYSGANPLLGEDFILNASTQKDKARVEVRAPVTLKEADILKKQEKKFSFSTLIFLILGALTVVVVAVFFFFQPEEENKHAQSLPPQRLVDRGRLEQLAKTQLEDLPSPPPEKTTGPTEPVTPPVVTSTPAVQQPSPQPVAATQEKPALATTSANKPSSSDNEQEKEKETPKKSKPTTRQTRKQATTAKEETNNSGATAMVSVNDMQGWAKVYIDGKFVSESPLINYQLSAGRHVIELRNSNGSVKRRWKINFPPGSHMKLVN